MNANTIKLPNGMVIDDIGDAKLISEEIWNNQYYSEVDEVIPSGIVIDIGANQGIFSIYAASKGAKVYAVEPNPVTYKTLLNNVQRNDFGERIVPLNVAVSEKEKDLNLYSFKLGNVTMTGLATTSEEVLASYKRLGYSAYDVISVKSMSFSELIEIIGVEESIACVKLDVEGSEMDILRGSFAESFARVGRIVMETHCGYLESSLLLELDRLGFYIDTFKKRLGEYQTGYLSAFQKVDADRDVCQKPIARLRGSTSCVVNSWMHFDARDSFCINNVKRKLRFKWRFNGEVIDNDGPELDVKVEKLGTGSVEVEVYCNNKIDSEVINIWAFSTFYRNNGVKKKRVKVGRPRQYVLPKGETYFRVDRKDFPAGWAWNEVQLVVEVDRVLEGDKAPVVVKFDGQSSECNETCVEYRLPFFPLDQDLLFSIEIESRAIVSINIVGTNSLPLDFLSPVLLEGCDKYTLDEVGVKHTFPVQEGVSIVVDARSIDPTPRVIKICVGLGSADEKHVPLEGAIFINNNLIHLSKWYYEVLVPVAVYGEVVELQFSNCFDRVYELTWWYE